MRKRVEEKVPVAVPKKAEAPPAKGEYLQNNILVVRLSLYHVLPKARILFPKMWLLLQEKHGFITNSFHANNIFDAIMITAMIIHEIHATHKILNHLKIHALLVPF